MNGKNATRMITLPTSTVLLEYSYSSLIVLSLIFPILLLKDTIVEMQNISKQYINCDFIVNKFHCSLAPLNKAITHNIISLRTAGLN